MNWFSNLFKNWFEKGNDWFDKGDFSKAFECYEKWLDANYILDEIASKIILANSNKALKANSNDAKAWLFKGIVYEKQEDYSKAIECYDKAIDLKPKYERAYNYKGNSLFGLGKHKEAIEYYDKAIALRSDYATAYNNKGVVLDDLGYDNEAIKCYKKAVSINNKFSAAYLNLGQSYYSMGELEKGIVYLEKALQLGNKNSKEIREMLNEARNVLKEKEENIRKGIKKWLIENTTMSNQPIRADRFVNNMRKTSTKCHWNDTHKNVYTASMNSVHGISGDNESYYYLCLDCYPYHFWTE